MQAEKTQSCCSLGFLFAWFLIISIDKFCFNHFKIFLFKFQLFSFFNHFSLRSLNFKIKSYFKLEKTHIFISEALHWNILTILKLFPQTFFSWEICQKITLFCKYNKSAFFHWETIHWKIPNHLYSILHRTEPNTDKFLFYLPRRRENLWHSPHYIFVLRLMQDLGLIAWGIVKIYSASCNLPLLHVLSPEKVL